MGKSLQQPSRSAQAGQSRTPSAGGRKAGTGSRNRDPAKWLHHSLRTIHKALKQAKNFEIRKITRRLSQARKEAVDSSKATGPNAISKLEQQLQAAKQADLDKLAQQAAAKAGLVVNNNRNNPTIAAAAAAAAAAAVAGPNGSTLGSAVHQRLISASCVQKQVTEQLNEFKRRFGDLHQQQMPQHSAAAADANVAATAYSDDEGTAAVAASELGSKRQKRSPAAAPASQTVNGHVSLVAGPRSSDDSGVIAADAELPTVNGEHATNTATTSKAESDDDGSSGSRSIDLEAEYEAQLRLVDVDHLDQPLDDSELDDATLAALDKLHNRSTAAAAAPDGDSGSDDSGVITDTDDATTSNTDSDQQQQEQQQGKQQRAKQQRQQQQQSDAVKYPPPPQLHKAENLQLKRRQKLEKILKSGKRLGQRMRRRLYEKLYGKDANHLKGDRIHGTKRVQPLASNCGGNASKGGISKARQQQRAANPQQCQQQDSRLPDRSEKQKRLQDLHPSWAARKQQQKQVSRLAVAAAAKKVVFGDDAEPVAGVHGPAQQQSHSKPLQQELPPKHQQPPHKQHNLPRQQQQQDQLSVGQQSSQSKQRHVSVPQQGGGGARALKSSGNPEKASGKLHPSWQAKKEQQTGIVAQPTGKKTFFADA